MRSPARQHFIRVSAAEASSSAGDDAMRADLTQYELHLAQLAEHRRRLKQIKSIQRKIEFKQNALPEYAAYVDGALEAATGAQDDVLTSVMVWRIDTEDYAGALVIAEYVLQHHLSLPDQYQRDAATVLAEEIAEQALASDQPGDLLAVLENVTRLVEGRDMPDEVSAKVHKALGYALRATEQPQSALAELQKALQLNQRVGVKKDIERLERQLKTDHE